MRRMLPLVTKQVTRSNSLVLTSKPCPQTSLVPYSTENRSIFESITPKWKIEITVKLIFFISLTIEKGNDKSPTDFKPLEMSLIKTISKLCID